MDGRGLTRTMLCLGAAALLIVSGCAKEEPGEGPLVAAMEEGADVPQELSHSEEAVFSKKSKLDSRLSPAMEEEVRVHFAHYLHERRETMEKFLRNSIPYINHVRSVFRSQGLPEELACLAYLESGYNPLAVSRSNAVGMWQFIASTGRNYGLRQDWWEDQRMDPYRSTEAAAEYLGRLYDIFKDWHLAVASYNGGEGKISRARAAAGADSLHEIIRRNDSLDASLQLREETVLYVPRFLAIAKIMSQPEALGLEPAAPEPGKPVLLPSVALTAPPATDLVELSRRLNMSWSEFLAYNPHFLRSISPAGRRSTVYIPRTKESEARTLLAGTLSGAGWTYYTVKKKQTLAGVASATGVPAAVVKQLNPGVVKAGRRLRLPAQRGSVPDRPLIIPQQSYVAGDDHVTAALAELSLPVARRNGTAARTAGRTVSSLAVDEKGRYTVKPGDTLSGLAQQCGVSVDELYALNGGAGALKVLKAGQRIRVPVPEKAVSHTVQSGETGYGIAAHYGVSFSALAAANGGTEVMEHLRAGQVLAIPGKAGTAAARPAASAGSAASSPAARPAATPKGAAASASVKPAAEKAASHTVQSGETGYGIAAHYGVSFSALAAANGGTEVLEHLRAGQVLAIPGKAGTAAVRPAASAGTAAQSAAARPAATPKGAAASASVKPAGKTESYRVQSGETLWSIARKFNMKPMELLNLNGMDQSTRVRAGDTVKVIRK
ncbi:LysM peptidoglycan-binding domain-containing protein [uncultured Mailhella sp.]|uniref:LysM peptidoglycan-binding domain-containing protein n=1 Tax=uncultured Mailhella sp. TaxID=1981031 RepID=UPI00260DC74F|nr:LysM peptidoglycan-binding domain-containing protein [uncultured Mailhella sp.]